MLFSRFSRRIVALGGALLASALVAVLGLPAGPADASATSPTKIGAWSKNWKWFDANVGPVDIYRGYDTGFSYPTWTQTQAYKSHPAAPQSDYTFNLPPADVAAGADDSELRTFIASTPRNIVLTNYHEPEQEIEDGLFTAAQFRAGEAHLAALVHAQNALDGGTRKVSLVLMISTFGHFEGRDPNTYWPTSADCANLTGAAAGACGPLDLVSTDAYALPHNTGTAGVPVGYTDGVSWKTAATLLKPAYTWSRTAPAWATGLKAGAPWAISELGYLEDVNDPAHRTDELAAAVSYAEANHALFVEYWDSSGGRADWELHFEAPAPTVSKTTTPASDEWKALVNAP